MKRSFNPNLRHGGLRTKWTPNKRENALAMRAQGATFEEIADVIGLSHTAVATEIADAPCPRSPSERRTFGRATEATWAPESVLIEREARLRAAERMSPVSIFLNEPPPGYSALDQKRRAEA